MMFSETNLKGSYIVTLNPYKDERGWFARTFCENEFKKINFTKNWVQLNHSFTEKKGTIRGMHFQNEPFNEIKLVRCIAGVVYDVIVDLRKNSSTFLYWFAIELSAENKKMIYIPEGFAHGFQALTDNVELIYHHSQFYEPGMEGGIKFDDPLINIKWELPITAISERDKQHKYLNENFNGF